MNIILFLFLIDYMMKKNTKIAVIGLGYVGLPLAKEFAKKFKVIGYDTNVEKIKQLKKRQHKDLFFSNNSLAIKDANIFIVCVPTPIKKNKTLI